VEIHPIVRIGRRAAEGVIEAATELDADLIVFGWTGKPPASKAGVDAAVFSPTIDEVRSRRTLRHRRRQAARPAEIHRILVPIRGGPHAELALRFADALARRNGATAVALHFVPRGVADGLRKQTEKALAHFIRQHTDGQVEQSVREAANIRNAILREAETADVVVMGASAAPATAGGEDVPVRCACPRQSRRGRRRP